MSPESRVAVGLTTLNEAEAIGDLLEALARQTRAPDEIVLVDAGSTDGTVAVVARYRERLPTLRLLEMPGANRARGRNAAIAAANAPCLVLTDAGCVPEPDWVERMIAPLAPAVPLTLVTGVAVPDARAPLEASIGRCTLSYRLVVGGVPIHPGGRALAFRRELWARVGGFPEAYDVCDDTAFILATASAGARIHREDGAVVRWRPRRSLAEVVRQFHAYAADLAWAGFSRSLHARTIAQSVGGLGLVALGLATRHWLPWAGLGALAGAYLGRKAWHGCFAGPTWRTYYQVPLILGAIHVGTMAGIVHGHWRRLAAARSDARPAR
jgi:glycosyltransferase involved in cell wall biosynthesis